jgi:hypothetical protein
MDEDKVLYEKLISENLEKNYQIKLVVSSFKGNTYLSLRKYFLSFDSGFVASKEGISMPFEMASSFNLLDGMIDLCSQSESAESVKHFIETNLESEPKSDV